MKSCVKDTPPSDVFVSDIVWRKAVFDPAELEQAIRDNAVAVLVGKVLAEHQAKPGYVVLLHDVVRAVMNAVVNRCFDGRQQQLAVVFSPIDPQRHHDRKINPAGWWVGDNVPVQEMYKGETK